LKFKDILGDWEGELKNILSDIKVDEDQLDSAIGGERYRWRDGFYVQIDSRFSKSSFDSEQSTIVANSKIKATSTYLHR
jgi:hypothetical protein